LEDLAADSAAVVEHARRSLVSVQHRGAGVGSGILWAPGWVVTNAHVARGRHVSVRQNGGPPVAARVRAHDGRLDLAVLEFEGESGEPAHIGDSTSLRPGDWVFAVGHPWGVRGAATGGAVIDSAAGPDRAWLALGLHLRPGHSGGAVVNVRGEVVGVNTMMNGPDVGLAISSAAIKRFLAEVELAGMPARMDRAA
jgi:serine protease Do